jgi:hypothetical protein
MNLKKILDSHRLWLDGQGGKRADFQGANLYEVDLSGADLQRANLAGADLQRVDLWGANLSCADLRRADLSEADLRGANLDGADLTGVDLFGTHVEGAKRGNSTLKSFKALTPRSDGHTFFLWDTEQGWRVEAGCHWFTFKEADQHWKKTREGTPLGDETFDILRFFKARAKR